MQLQVIMRSMYLQFSQNLNTNIKEQIIELNRLVEEYCIPKILSEIEQYIGYKKDVNNLPVPLDRSENLSIKGTKTLILKNF